MSGNCSTSAQHRGRTVLVVEDNELNRKLLEVRLEIQGYLSLCTDRGEAALDMAREQQPDLILMDIQLPGISGVDVIKQLKADERTKDIPIIAVTAFAMSYDESKILASGCDGYLAKPFRGQDLVEAIERCIR